VNWQQYLDYVHCSPSFHGHERHDFIILKTANSFIFAQLAFIFTCSVAEDQYPVCLAHTLDAPISKSQWAKDHKLRLHHLCKKPSMEFIFVQSIVCCTPLVQDFAKPGNYFVMDVIDHSGDIFIHCSEIFSELVIQITDPSPSSIWLNTLPS
ncbi:hypothetical protein EI94DRAFT_1562340, partial [Lactarius quietus]